MILLSTLETVRYMHDSIYPCLRVTIDTDDLAYCGSDSEEENLTIQDATLKYKTECRICPEIECDTVAYLREETELELTCWTPEGHIILDDP
jgi:hypothetical protein